MSGAWPGEFISTLDMRPIGVVRPGRATAERTGARPDPAPAGRAPAAGRTPAAG